MKSTILALTITALLSSTALMAKNNTDLKPVNQEVQKELEKVKSDKVKIAEDKKQLRLDKIALRKEKKEARTNRHHSRKEKSEINKVSK